MRLRFGLSLVLAGLTGPATALAQGGGSLTEAASQQKDPKRVALDNALKQLRSEAYGPAAVALYQLADENKELEDEARYNLGKALYRDGYLHSALAQFEKLLSAGSKSRFYKASLEWCLFIGRKMSADDRVNEVVAKYAQGDFPSDYRDEFYFRLARFHFSRALAIEGGEIAGQLGETKVKESETGGLSVSGDIFGDGPSNEPEPEPEEDEASVKERDGGGLSIDEDIFGDPTPKKEKPKKKKKKAKKVSSDGELSPLEHTEAAKRYVMRVSDASDYGPRAKFLEALVLYKMGSQNEALDSFKTVVRLTRDEDVPEKERVKAEELREAAFFQLARTHFGAKQPSFSIFYYDKVNRDSYQWLDALYEESWAQFRLGDYEKALGNLLTVHAPFFEDSYFPESHILKAVIYYENCRYDEAKKILSKFLGRYEPVLKELEEMTARSQSADAYYEQLENLRGDDLAESGTDKALIMQSVLQIALSDPELKRLDASYQEVQAELARVEEGGGALAGSDLQASLAGVLSEVKTMLGRKAGRAVKNQLERERAHIKELIQQAIRIDIETSRSEQERIESQLRAVQSRPKDIDKEFVKWADDEKLVWPFEGEYWRDELGTYELTLAHSCR